MSRLRRAAPWLLPPAVLILLFRYGLRTWFLQDDFAWLQLAAGVWDGDSLLKALFTPMAQGTVRPLSERAFFIGLYGLFGLNGLPFRVLVFLTQIANLALIGWITRRLTGSALAATAAPILWACGSCLYVVMSWNSVFNQALCAFFILAAFAFGLARAWRLEWAAYLAGFAALEITVVYPALALAHSALFRRDRLRPALWLLAPAIAFAAVHAVLVPKVTRGPYEMHFDFSMVGSLWTYWQWALGPAQLAMVARMPALLAAAVTGLLTAAILGFAAARWLRGDRLPGFFLFWFLATLAPVLPLAKHVSDYYLTIPSIGLAMLGGYALHLGWQAGHLSQAVAVSAVLLYLGTSVPAAAINTRATHDQSKRAKALVLGVAYAHQFRPSAVLVLAGVNTQLFWDAVRDRSFELVGASQVYVPEAEAGSIHVPKDVLDPYLLPDEALVRGIEKGRVQVYDVRGARLRNVTATYRAKAGIGLAVNPARRVDAGNPLLEYALLDGWYPLEKGFRWMGRRAAIRLGGPALPEQRIRVSGRCPEVLLAQGPISLRLSVDGEPSGQATISKAGAFELDFRPPEGTLGKQHTDVTLELDRTYRPPASARDLGLVLGVIEVR